MKKFLFKVHKYLSLIFFIPIIIVSLSGALLVYKYEIDKSLMKDVVSVQKETSTLTIETLKHKINKTHPNYEIVGWVIPQNKNKAHRVYLIKHHNDEWESIYINPYTSEILDKVKAHDSYFMDWILEIHENFLLEDSGNIILLILGLIILIISISGLFIYKNFWKNIFLLRFKSLFIYMSDLHKMVGVFSSILLFIIGFTGVYWNLAIIVNNSNPITYDIQSPLYNENISLDDLEKKSQNTLKGFELTYISFPYHHTKDITFYGHIKKQNSLYHEYASHVVFNKNNGNIISSVSVKNLPIGQSILELFRKAHFGSYNEFTKFLWFFIGLTPIILSFTGIYLWIKKRKKSSKK